ARPPRLISATTFRSRKTSNSVFEHGILSGKRMSFHPAPVTPATVHRAGNLFRFASRHPHFHLDEHRPRRSRADCSDAKIGLGLRPSAAALHVDSVRVL